MFKIFNDLNFMDLNYNQIQGLKYIRQSKLFQLGLLIKVLLIIFCNPEITSSLFIPFIKNSITYPSYDPWNNFYLNSGDINSFPYGLSMFLSYMPLSFLGNFIDKYFIDFNFISIGFKFSSLIFDFLLLNFLSLLTKNKKIILLIISYWLSPIIIFATYVHGQLDILPITLLIMSVYFIKINKYTLSGFLITLSILSKFSMLIALPFIYIYVIKRKGFSNQFYKLSISFLSSFIFLIFPFLFSEGYWKMVFGTKEINRIYNVFISYGGELKLFIIPVIYILSLYLVWRLQRITQDLFMVSLGLGFLSILVFLPPAPGWTLWVVPFISYYQITSKRDLILISVIYSLSYIASIYFIPDYSNIEYISNNNFVNAYNSIISETLIKNIFFTFHQGLGLLIAIRIYIYGLRKNNFYNISDKPMIISLSGYNNRIIEDLKLSINKLFYRKFINIIDLENNAKRIKQKENGINKVAYNINYISNSLNKLQDKISENTKEYLLIVNQTNLEFICNPDLSIIINKSLDKDILNEFDLNKKLLIFNFNFYENLNKEISYSKDLKTLTTYFRLGFLHKKLFSLLISISSLNVDMELQNKDRLVKMVIAGNPSKEDIFQIANVLLPELDDFSLNDDSWSSGFIGIIQIILIANLLETLKNRY